MRFHITDVILKIIIFLIYWFNRQQYRENTYGCPWVATLKHLRFNGNRLVGVSLDICHDPKLVMRVGTFSCRGGADILFEEIIVIFIVQRVGNFSVLPNCDHNNHVNRKWNIMMAMRKNKHYRQATNVVKKCAH